MSSITVIDPATGHEHERDSDGRWKPGRSGNPGGRPSAAGNISTRQLREAVTGALDDVSGGDGGRMYFTIMAATRPELFLPLIARLFPIKLAGDDEGQEFVVTRIERVIMQAPTKK